MLSSSSSSSVFRTTHQSIFQDTNSGRPSWIRGVNLGGWLVLERYITPYQFAITDCHVRGDFCWYSGALSAPSPNDPTYKECNINNCQIVTIPNAYNKSDYPIDEVTLAQAFRGNNGTMSSTKFQKNIAEQWFDYHFMNFIKMEDLVQIQQAGVTHMRVPVPHWIMGDVLPHEPWIVGKRWEAFVQVCKWARELGLQVWPDIHTAPKSQNGFDNSGQALPYTTCQVWLNDPINVKLSLSVIRKISQGVLDAEIQDVVTGIGLLNEPYADCDIDKYKSFIEAGLDLVRHILGADTVIYVSDMFQANKFNNGTWWLDPSRYNNTYLDSHYYQVFDQSTRTLSPRQHIAFTCENHHRHTTECCYIDGPTNNTKPSLGVAHMVGEWSASFDILPDYRVSEIMKGIAETGVAPYFDRTLSLERQAFLRNYVEAQMVTWEDTSVNTLSKAWFYWTFKTEGGAFAEWSFLRGIKEGWFPTLAPPHIPSESLYGTCNDIIFRTNDSMNIVTEIPDPTKVWTQSSVVVDDDVVLSHGAILWNQTHDEQNVNTMVHNNKASVAVIDFLQHWQLPIGVMILLVGVFSIRWLTTVCKRSKYNRIHNLDEVMTMNV